MTRHLIDSNVDRVFGAEGQIVGITVEMIFYNEQIDEIETVVRNKSFINQTEPIVEEKTEEELFTQDAIQQ